MSADEVPKSPCPEGAEAQPPEPDAGEERPGLPDPSTVVAEETFTSPKGRTYRILRTDQTDAYDEPVEKEKGDP